MSLAGNPCLCGVVPDWIARAQGTDLWANGTGLFASDANGSCSSSCVSPAPSLPPLWHPDLGPLQALKSAVVASPGADATALLGTWDALRVPCSERDPLCVPCNLTTPAANCSGAAPPVAGSPPQWYCNFQGVACREGRVVGLNLTGANLTLSTIPPGGLALSKAETLREWMGLEDLRFICVLLEHVVLLKPLSGGAMSGHRGFKCVAAFTGPLTMLRDPIAPPPSPHSPSHYSLDGQPRAQRPSAIKYQQDHT